MTSEPRTPSTEASFDLMDMSEDWRAGWRALEAHMGPLSTWRGTCGHLWDRAVENTDVCPRCGAESSLRARLVAEVRALPFGTATMTSLTGSVTVAEMVNRAAVLQVIAPESAQENR